MREELHARRRRPNVGKRVIFLVAGAAWIVSASSASSSQALVVSAEPHCVHERAARPIDYLLPFLVLKIERDVVLLNGKPVKESEVANGVLMSVKTSANATIHVLVDAEVRYGRVMSILKLIPKRSSMRTIILTPSAMCDLGDNFCWFRDGTP